MNVTTADQRRIYVVTHRSCGHVLACHANRAMFEPFVARMAELGNYGYRTRIATDDDLAALIAGVRCDVCTMDGETVAAS